MSHRPRLIDRLAAAGNLLNEAGNVAEMTWTY